MAKEAVDLLVLGCHWLQGTERVVGIHLCWAAAFFPHCLALSLPLYQLLPGERGIVEHLLLLANLPETIGAEEGGKSRRASSCQSASSYVSWVLNESSVGRLTERERVCVCVCVCQWWVLPDEESRSMWFLQHPPNT